MCNNSSFEVLILRKFLWDVYFHDMHGQAFSVGVTFTVRSLDIFTCGISLLICVMTVNTAKNQHLLV